MKYPVVPFDKILEQKLEQLMLQAKMQWRRNWPKLIIMAAVAFFVSKRDLSIDVNLNAGGWLGEEESMATTTSGYEESPVKAMNTSLLTKAQPVAYKEAPKPAHRKKDKDNLANTYSNMVYTKGDFSTKETTGEQKEKRRKQLAYVERFYKVAQTEMEKYGIPASITLAQGLLESNVGESRLAVKNNNHFGIKCFSRSCKRGHCSNFTDDSHKDFFRIYKSPWESYRAHSQLLKRGRYNNLFNLASTDYKGWAYGLKKAGYATDRYYAEKLINTIDDLDLHQYDQEK